MGIAHCLIVIGVATAPDSGKLFQALGQWLVEVLEHRNFGSKGMQGGLNTGTVQSV